MKCTLCGVNLFKGKVEEYFDCPICRGWVKDSSLYPSPDEERLHYQTHNNDVKDPRYIKFTSPIINFILENFTSNQEGLDFGSGTGPVISKVLKAEAYNVLQYDPYFANYPNLLEKQFDYIFACEVVEHFYNPLKDFGKLFAMLKENGKLIIMTHLYEDSINFNSWYYRKDPTHVFIYRKETFLYIAAKFGFKEVAIKERLVVLSR